MGATRQRFTKDELVELFPDNVIEIRHGSVWRKAVVLNGEIKTDSIGMQYCVCKDIAPTTRTAGKGQIVHAYSKQMRASD